jgi:hypothetical protein
MYQRRRLYSEECIRSFRLREHRWTLVKDNHTNARIPN